MSARRALWGLLAQFPDPQSLARAVEEAREAGYRRIEAYTPWPIEEVKEALGAHDRRVPLFVLLGGLAGGIGGYYLQYWVSVLAYPLNVGGRPYHSWPAFVPPTFELTVLGATIVGILAMLALNGLPRPSHPLFEIPEFERASQDGFFLSIQADDPRFDLPATRKLLADLGATGVHDVPAEE
ncbi:MAG: DUF3341 domain-containing protein [Candidatus Eisenbacteria bacterium]|nr:DUF3341 domain-containing protein [Candidatus Eisenbacteria bacterium]